MIALRTMVPLSDIRLCTEACTVSHSRIRGSASTTWDSALTAAARTVIAVSSSAPRSRSTRMCRCRARGSCCCSVQNRRIARGRDNNTPPSIKSVNGESTALFLITFASDLYVARSPPGPTPPTRNPTFFRSDSLESCASTNVNALPLSVRVLFFTSFWRMYRKSMDSNTNASVDPLSVTSMFAASATPALESAASCCAISNAVSISGERESFSTSASPSPGEKSSLHSFSFSHSSVSDLTLAATCPRKSMESSRNLISEEFMPYFERSCAHSETNISDATGHSGMFSVVSKSLTRFCIRDLISISCALAECHPRSSSFQK